MIRSTLVLVLCSSLGLVDYAQGAGSSRMPKTAYSMEHCLGAALDSKAGEVKAVEMELINQVPVYEFTIVMADKSEWEVACNAMTGKVIAIEEDAVADTGNEEQVKAEFDRRARVSEEQARAIALRAHPGEVDEVERKLTAAKVPVYEIEITMSNGVKREVEVDALSGLIIGVEEEIYAIGDD